MSTPGASGQKFISQVVDHEVVAENHFQILLLPLIVLADVMLDSYHLWPFVSQHRQAMISQVNRA